MRTTIALLVLLSVGCVSEPVEEPLPAPPVPPTITYTVTGDPTAEVMLYDGEVRLGGPIDVVISFDTKAFIFLDS